jgi:hypothetical protein
MGNVGVGELLFVVVTALRRISVFMAIVVAVVVSGSALVILLLCALNRSRVYASWPYAIVTVALRRHGPWRRLDPSVSGRPRACAGWLTPCRC